MNAFGRYLDSPASTDDRDKKVLEEWVKHAKMSLDAEERGERIVYAKDRDAKGAGEKKKPGKKNNKKKNKKKGEKKKKNGGKK